MNNYYCTYYAESEIIDEDPPHTNWHRVNHHQITVFCNNIEEAYCMLMRVNVPHSLNKRYTVSITNLNDPTEKYLYQFINNEK